MYRGLDMDTPTETLLKARICSDHFRSDDFVQSHRNDNKSLSSNAVPAVFPDAPTATDEQVITFVSLL